MKLPLADLKLPLADLPVRAGLAAVNRLLRRQPWALERLQPHAGRHVALSLPALPVTLGITPDGLLAPAGPAAPIDASIELPPLSTLRLLARRPVAAREFAVRGDTHLAADLAYVFQHLDWQLEEELSGLVGDIAAHRIVQAGSGLHAWQKETARRWALGVADYLTEERALLARPAQVRAFVDAVDTLRDDTDRLEKKLEQLDKRR